MSSLYLTIYTMFHVGSFWGISGVNINYHDAKVLIDILLIHPCICLNHWNWQFCKMPNCKKDYFGKFVIRGKKKKKGQTVVEGAYFRFKIRRWNIIYIHCACKHTFIWGRSYLPTINTQNIITNNLKYMRIHIYMMCYPISLSFFPVDNLYSHHWNTQFCSFFLGPMYLVLILKNNKNIPVVNQLHSQDQYTI